MVRNNRMPKVTVIIPTCNRSASLRNAIASVLAQTFTDLEILVVDDASGDNTREVVEEFKESSIQYIRHDANCGGAVARNTGITHSRSEYIAFLDDDDEWLPNKLEVQMKVFEHCSPQVGAIYTGHRNVNRETGETIGIWRPLKKGHIYEDLMKKNWVSTTSSVVLKRECLKNVGTFDERLPSFQDYDLWIRIAREYLFEYVDEILVTYYEHRKKIWTNHGALEKGIDVMVDKYAQSKELKKNFSYHYLGLGERCLMNGDMKKGRELLRKGMELYPFEIKHYLNWGVSLLGGEMFRASHRMKRMWGEWLRKS